MTPQPALWMTGPRGWGPPEPAPSCPFAVEKGACGPTRRGLAPRPVDSGQEMRLGPSSQPDCSQTLLCPALPPTLRPPRPPCVHETEQAPCSPCSYYCLEHSVPCCPAPSTQPFDVLGGLGRSFPVPPRRHTHRWARTPPLSAPSQSGRRSDLSDGAGDLCFAPIAGSPGVSHSPFIRRGRVSAGTPPPADFVFRSVCPNRVSWPHQLLGRLGGQGTELSGQDQTLPGWRLAPWQSRRNRGDHSGCCCPSVWVGLRAFSGLELVWATAGVVEAGAGTPAPGRHSSSHWWAWGL